MANKRPKPEEIVSKLRQVEVLMGQGMAPSGCDPADRRCRVRCGYSWDNCKRCASDM